MIYYISNELSHHGVKGMRWGVRKRRVSSGIRRTSSSRKKMSTAKKVAIGVGVAAAVAGATAITIHAVKTGKANQIKKGRAAANQIYMNLSRSGAHRVERKNIRRGADSSDMILRGYDRRTGDTKISRAFYSPEDRPKLVGHSGRRGRYGAAQDRLKISDRELGRIEAEVKSGNLSPGDYDWQWRTSARALRDMERAPSPSKLKNPAYKRKIRRLN